MSSISKRKSLNWRHALQWSGLGLGPLLAWICYLTLPDRFLGTDGGFVYFEPAGRATLSMMVWMGVWWLTEAIDIVATALLPLTCFPLLGIADMRSTAAPYADPLIFLFVGGFFLAQAMSRWSLDRRIALSTLLLVGTRPDRMVAGFMLATAGLSAFVSNTATAAMMLPIALSVVRLTQPAGDAAPADDSRGPVTSLSTCLMLGIAYAASIGGVVTIIGTPPNVFLTGFLRNGIAEPYRSDLTFVRWLPIGVTLAVILLPATWWLLTQCLFSLSEQTIEGGKQMIRRQLAELGPWKLGERATLFLFAVTAVGWIIRPWLVEWSVSWRGGEYHPLASLTDSGVVMFTATLLFVVPVDLKARQFVLDWRTAERIPWGALLLFGGGLTLANACRENGVVEFLGSFSSLAKGCPAWLLVLGVTTFVVFLTELTSNLATVATFLPVLAALAPGLGIHPYLLIIPAAISASCAFMLPVATPPNAIVFASGRVHIQQMIRAGFWLNLISIAVVTAIAMLIARPIFGV